METCEGLWNLPGQEGRREDFLEGDWREPGRGMEWREMRRQQREQHRQSEPEF